jgi:hypothetical protein
VRPESLLEEATSGCRAKPVCAGVLPVRSHGMGLANGRSRVGVSLIRRDPFTTTREECSLNKCSPHADRKPYKRQEQGALKSGSKTRVLNTHFRAIPNDGAKGNWASQRLPKACDNQRNGAITGWQRQLEIQNGAQQNRPQKSVARLCSSARETSVAGAM